MTGLGTHEWFTIFKNAFTVRTHASRKDCSLAGSVAFNSSLVEATSDWKKPQNVI